jgi:3-hydroxyacyl-[acyl-carrier-protein] dehydratase
MKTLLKEIEKYSIKHKPHDNPLVIEKIYCFDEKFLGFSGHFPGYPILPAVLQLLLAQLCIEEQKGYKISITSIEKAKFISEIRPDELITIQCADADADTFQRSKVNIISGEKVLSTFNLFFYPIKENDIA